MSDDEPIQAKHLPDDFFEDLKQRKNNKNQFVDSTTVQIKQPIEQLTIEDKIEADKAELLQVYNEYKGNISQTAKALTISRNTLYKRLKEIGIR